MRLYNKTNNDWQYELYCCREILDEWRAFRFLSLLCRVFALTMNDAISFVIWRDIVCELWASYFCNALGGYPYEGNAINLHFFFFFFFNLFHRYV